MQFLEGLLPLPRILRGVTPVIAAKPAFIGLVALWLACAGTGPVQAQQEVRFPWKQGWLKEFDDGKPTGDLTGRLFKPAGDAAAPFVVFLHGCAGMSLQLQEHWAQFFVARGVGFLLVDSLGPRRVDSICQDSKNPWARRRADDANSALAWLREQPFARPDRIALMGQSHGGGSALLAIHENTLGGKTFVAGLMMYPACAFGNAAKVRFRKPILILIGEDDDWTPAAQCQTLKAGQPDPGTVEVVVYPGAAHSFDNPVRSALVFGKYRVGEHPASRDKARERVAVWIDAVLK